MNKRVGTIVLAMLFIFFHMSVGLAEAEYSDFFVVHNGNKYVVTYEEAKPEQVGTKIGEVTAYNQNGRHYAGNFSNIFPVGTAYYGLQGEDVLQSIAVQVGENVYVKATYSEKYVPDRPLSWGNIIFIVIVGALLGAVVVKRIRTHDRAKELEDDLMYHSDDPYHELDDFDNNKR